MSKQRGNEGKVDAGGLGGTTRRSRRAYGARRVHGALRTAGALTAATALAVASGGCRTDILKERAPIEQSRLAARVDVVEGFDCATGASVVKAPDHCAWPREAGRTQVLSATMQVVAHVGPDGRAQSVRVVDAPEGNGFGAAAVQCAMQAEYRPPKDAAGTPVAGETCPVSLRLARYPTDLDGQDGIEVACAPVRTFRPTTAVNWDECSGGGGVLGGSGAASGRR